jgi:hypothetical protein
MPHIDNTSSRSDASSPTRTPMPRDFEAVAPDNHQHAVVVGFDLDRVLDLRS